jgi:hypothetical protein
MIVFKREPGSSRQAMAAFFAIPRRGGTGVLAKKFPFPLVKNK